MMKRKRRKNRMDTERNTKETEIREEQTRSTFGM